MSVLELSGNHSGHGGGNESHTGFREFGDDEKWLGNQIDFHFLAKSFAAAKSFDFSETDTIVGNITQVIGETALNSSQYN